MKVFFDTNVVLDVLLDREPFSLSAAQLLSKVEKEEISGYVCATTMTTIYYLAVKVLGTRQAKKKVAALMSFLSIAPVNRTVLESALSSKFKDFEDAVIHEAALHSDVQSIVTRDVKGFKNAGLPVYLPDELIKILALQQT